MDTKRGIFFLGVILIIIVSIYYIVKMFKGLTSYPPSPSVETDKTYEISISDLNFERTLNPDKSNSKSDIVGYTIEYDEGINFEELSKNVTFTINWKNNIGFTGNVEGFIIDHYVKVSDDAGFIRYQYKELKNKGVININNYEKNSIQIISDGTYSVIGKNRFIIKVIMKIGPDNITVYNGVDQENDSLHEITITKDQLGATLSMTKSETVKYIPVTNTFSKSYSIKKVKYSISNGNSSLNFAGSGSIYLMPAFVGDDNNAETFFFKYELGENQYLLEDGTKGEWNGKTEREPNAEFDSSIYDNRMFVAFYNKNENENIMQLRAPVMGYGLGGKFLTSDESGKLKLIDISENDAVKETEFKNSYWKFTEVEGDPVNCQGEWVVTDDGTTSGKKIEEFEVTSEAINNGTCEYKGKTRETPVNVNCQGYWEVTDDGTTSGTKTEIFKVTSEAKNNGTCEASEGDIRQTPVNVNCQGYWVVTDDGTTSGTKTEIFEVTTSAKNNGTCEASEGAIRQTPVDVHCKGDWGDWGDCSKTCGGGTKTRNWITTTKPKNNGTACPDPSTQSQSCNTQSCQTCKAKTWSDRSICSQIYNQSDCNNKRGTGPKPPLICEWRE